MHDTGREGFRIVGQVLQTSSVDESFVLLRVQLLWSVA